MFILVSITDYTIANKLSRRVLTLLKGLIKQKKLCRSPKSQVSTAMGKFYKRISNYIKTCSTTPNTGKFATAKGWAKKHKSSIACDHTTGRFIKTRSNNRQIIANTDTQLIIITITLFTLLTGITLNVFGKALCPFQSI